MKKILAILMMFMVTFTSGYAISSKMSGSEILGEADSDSISNPAYLEEGENLDKGDTVTFEVNGKSYKYKYTGDDSYSKTADDWERVTSNSGDGAGEFIDDSIDTDAFIEKVMELINPLISTFGSALIFFAVIMVGFDVIRHKNNAEERTKSMTSILYLAIGALIIGSASLVASFVWSLRNEADSKTNTGLENTIEVVREINM